MKRDKVRVLLALNMKRHRERLGISGDALAERTGVTGNYIRRIETQRAWPSSQVLEAIAKGLRSSIADLFTESKKTGR